MNALGVQFRRTGASPGATLEAPAIARGGTLVLAWDGRIDNRDDLGARLGIETRTLAAMSDEALLLHALRHRGVDGLGHIVGDYAFALWDERTQALLCARDPMGQRPLFYHASASIVVAASSVAAVVRHPGVPRRPNEGVVAEYLAAAITSPDETLFDGVKRVQPGTWVRFDSDGERHGTIDWIDPRAEIQYTREEDYAEHLRDLLRVAVRARLRGTTRVGIELSGGLDSSTVAGVTRAELGDEAVDRVLLLSLVFPGLSCDERPLIDACHQAWSLPSYVLAGSGSVAADPAHDSHHLDFPYYPNGTMSIGLRRYARAQGIRVLLTGIGGDEWFSGSRFRIADDLRRGRILRAIGHARRDAQTDPGVGIGSALWAFGAWPCVPRTLKHVVRALRGVPTMTAPWLTDTLITRTRLAQRVRVQPASPDFPTFAQSGMFKSALGAWSVHGTEMEARLAADLGIELRHPLADMRVVRFGLSIPEAQRWSGHERKRALRAAAASLVPDAVRCRGSKVDFSPLVVQALEAQGGSAFFQELGTAALGWVRPAPLERMYADMHASYLAGNADYMGPAWTLWMISGIERWARAAGFVEQSRLRVRATA